jgi:hypothetical protein
MSNNPDFERKIVEMLEALTKMKINEILSKELEDPNMKIVYEMTGKGSTSEIVKASGFSAGKISSIWQEWYDKGIIKKDGKFYKKIFEG